MKSKRQLEDAVVRAAMRWHRAFLKVGTSWYFQGVPMRIENGLVNACTRLAARRRKRG